MRNVPTFRGRKNLPPNDGSFILHLEFFSNLSVCHHQKGRERIFMHFGSFVKNTPREFDRQNSRVVKFVRSLKSLLFCIGRTMRALASRQHTWKTVNGTSLLLVAYSKPSIRNRCHLGSKKIHGNSMFFWESLMLYNLFIFLFLC